MTFNSYSFLLAFLPIALIGNYICIKFNKNWKLWLLVISVLFYAINGSRSVPFIILEVVVNFIFYKKIQSLKSHRKMLLIFSVTCNVLVLLIFKYLDFFTGMLNSLHLADFQALNIVLPTGISFITFQQIAFLVDAYNNPSEDYSLLDYSVFVAFFPHISSGPIVLSRQFMPFLKDIKSIDWQRISSGIYLFAIGLAKKVLIADSLAGGVDYVYSNLDTMNASSILFYSLL